MDSRAGIVTVVGGSDKVLNVTIEGSQAFQLAQDYENDLNNHYNSDDLDVLDLFGNDDLTNQFSSKSESMGVISHGGNYTLQDSKLNYLVAGKWVSKKDGSPAYTTDEKGNHYTSTAGEEVTVNSAMAAGRHVRVLAGIENAFTYNAGLEGGEFIGGNSKGNIIFNGSTLPGANQAKWEVTTGDGNDRIFTGASSDIVNAGLGNNMIILGTGNNSVQSLGHDTITAPTDGTGGYNTITIYGGNSEVDVGAYSVVNDVSNNNVITVGGASTVMGGRNSTITFGESKDANGLDIKGVSEYHGGVQDTIDATVTHNPLQIIHGDSNTFNINGDFRFFNGTGKTTIHSHGGQGDVSSQLFGADGLDLTFTSDVNDPTKMLVSGSFGGNETLDGSGAAGKLLIYADTTAGAHTHLVAQGGSNDDTLVGGVGNSTLTGGKGADTFLFTDGSTANGNTVITDFAKGTDKISLMNFGYDSNNVQKLIDSAVDGNGGLVMQLNNHHKITIEGISKDQLNSSDFSFWNDPNVTNKP